MSKTIDAKEIVDIAKKSVRHINPYASNHIIYPDYRIDSSRGIFVITGEGGENIRDLILKVRWSLKNGDLFSEDSLRYFLAEIIIDFYENKEYKEVLSNANKSFSLLPNIINLHEVLIPVSGLGIWNDNVLDFGEVTLAKLKDDHPILSDVKTSKQVYRDSIGKPYLSFRVKSDSNILRQRSIYLAENILTFLAAYQAFDHYAWEKACGVQLDFGESTLLAPHLIYVSREEGQPRPRASGAVSLWTEDRATLSIIPNSQIDMDTSGISLAIKSYMRSQAGEKLTDFELEIMNTIWWVGDSFRQTSDPKKIFSCVAAMDALVGTSNAATLSVQLGMSILSGSTGEERKHIRESVKRIYESRNEIAHGRNIGAPVRAKHSSSSELRWRVSEVNQFTMNAIFNLLEYIRPEQYGQINIRDIVMSKLLRI